jgi:hypothetical protein
VVLWLNHQTTMSSELHTHSPRPKHMSCRSSIALVRVPSVSPWLVAPLLQSLDQGPTLVLRCSRPISTNPHDLQLCHRLLSLYYTPAHHKPIDMVAQTHIRVLWLVQDPHQSTTHVDNHSSSTRTTRDKCHTRVLGVQSPGANINTRCAGTKSHTYDA